MNNTQPISTNQKYVLIVEDEHAYASLLKKSLIEQNYHVEIAGDGGTALESMAEIAPDLVILDLILPKKGGYEVLEAMQENEELKGIKVLVLSNLGQKDEIERALKLGALDFVIKTDIALNEMVKKVKHFCPN